MVIRRNRKKSAMQYHAYHSYHGKKKMFFGFLLFLVGLLMYMGYGWDIILMVVGALVFVKGIILKARCKS